MPEFTNLIAATAAFVGLHFLLSHPLRRPLVARMGEGTFLGLYSVIALASFVWMVIAARAIESDRLHWGAPDWAWSLAGVVMLLASILFAGSLVANPAAPNATQSDRPIGEARGVYAVTRHPMMWAFMLWAVVHAALWPTTANLILCGGIFILAFFGARAQDAKKERLIGDVWRDWEARTAFWPLGAQLSGRSPWRHIVPGAVASVGGIALWLAATFAHEPLGAPVVGLWRWLAG